MNATVQGVIVAVLVVAAAVYATWLLLPSRSRSRVARWLGFKSMTARKSDDPCDRCSVEDDGKAR